MPGPYFEAMQYVFSVTLRVHLLYIENYNDAIHCMNYTHINRLLIKVEPCILVKLFTLTYLLRVAYIMMVSCDTNRLKVSVG